MILIFKNSHVKNKDIVFFAFYKKTNKQESFYLTNEFYVL